MINTIISALLVEDNATDIKLIRRALSGRINPQYKLTLAENLQDAIAQSAEQLFDVVLLDLNLMDSSGLQTLESFHSKYPLIPKVILTGVNDHDIAIRALLGGAQDYLVKGQIDDELLSRVLQYAIERNQINTNIIENENKLRLLIKHCPVAIAAFDRNMRYVMTSQRWLDDYGFKEELILGEYHYDVLTGISEKWKQLHQRCLEGQMVKSEEDLIAFPDGRQEWTRWEMHPWRQADGQVGGIIVFREVITERKQSENRLHEHKDELELRVQQRTAELEGMYRHLEEVREQERTTIAREVHDQLGQSLTALKMDIAWIQKNRLNAEQIEEKLQGMSDLASSTIKLVQKICAELRPGILDDLGLIAAIEWQTEEFQKRSNIPVQMQINYDDSQLDRKQATTIFRVYQETLTNILRHAEATLINVRLSQLDDIIYFEVQDNGKGFDPQEINMSNSFGLIGIRERVKSINGELLFDGGLNKGMHVKIRIPVAQGGMQYA